MTKLKKEVNVPEVEKGAFWMTEETKGRNSKITDMLLILSKLEHSACFRILLCIFFLFIYNLIIFIRFFFFF